MENCANHPDHSAVEHCEVCQRPLCALCLWYGADGRRLCEEHAREREAAGEEVLPPETYAAALSSTLNQKQAVNQNNNPYRGNSHDLTALVAVVMALTTLGSCMGGAYCLPFAAAALGLAAYTNATKAVDPKRTKELAGISLGVGALMLLAVMAYVLFMVVIVVFSFVLPIMLGTGAFSSP